MLSALNRLPTHGISAWLVSSLYTSCSSSEACRERLDSQKDEALLFALFDRFYLPDLDSSELKTYGRIKIGATGVQTVTKRLFRWMNMEWLHIARLAVTRLPSIGRYHSRTIARDTVIPRVSLNNGVINAKERTSLSVT